MHALRLSRSSSRLLALLGLLLLLPLLPLLPDSRGAGAVAAEPPALPERTARGPNADFFGIVGRDPWYEWNTDPARFPNDVNRDALEGMARDLAQAGAGWIRIELRAQHDDPKQGGPGYIDWRKWDWFIKECAPKYGLKVLLLLGSAVIADNRSDPTVSFARINDEADRPDGTNNYIRLYTTRAKEVADHFGDSVAAYEILNEPNINEILQSDTNGEQMEFNHQNFGALLAEVYGAIKPAHPRPQLIVGGLLYSPRANSVSADVDYLWELYRAPRLQQYRAANGRYPFDGVSIHAYFIDRPRDIVDHLKAVRGVMFDAGDTEKVWLTEIGYQGAAPPLDPSYLAADPTASELEQAQFIRELFTLLTAETRWFVANVFWFKYEDFPYKDTWVSYGLVRLPITSRGAYAQPPQPRKTAYAAYQAIANPGAMPTAPESPGAQPPDAYYFPQTQHAISGAFRAYWEQNGGLMRFGYPLTSVFEAGGLRVQYFERARFEWHPEKPDPYKVELGLLTAYLTRGRTFPKATPTTPTPAPSPSPTPGPSPSSTANPATPTPTPRATTATGLSAMATGTPTSTATATTTTTATTTATASPTGTSSPTAPRPPEPTPAYFPQTGHTLGGEFLKYWQARGGLASFGYPLSEELREVNQADGKTYAVQYFERARFEYHPENQGTEFVVLLGLMGREVLTGGGWYR